MLSNCPLSKLLHLVFIETLASILTLEEKQAVLNLLEPSSKLQQDILQGYSDYLQFLAWVLTSKWV